MIKVIKVIASLLICTFLGCSLAASRTPEAPRGMSPEETVQYYFLQFNNKNQSGMDSVVYKKMQGMDSDLGNLVYVKLNSCVEEKDASKIEIENSWYNSPYKISLVNVTFDINYKNGGGDGFSNGKYEWKYYLVKENEKSDWIIVEWGMG